MLVIGCNGTQFSTKYFKKQMLYRVVSPPLANMVCPVIHQPSVTKNSTSGAISLILVNQPNAAADLWYATASGPSWP